MNILSTISEIKSTNQVLLVIIFIIGFASISCANAPTDSLNKDSSKYLSFYETIDGERVHWEANFYGDEITSIYKNGKRIPDELAADYKDKVYGQLDDMRFGGNKFTFRMPNLSGKEFHFDMEELHKELEEMKKELPELKENFQFHHFDSEEFEKEMEELKEELEEGKSHIYKFDFNEEEFKEQMEKLQKELKENLPKLKKFKFEFDIEEEDTEV